MTPVSYSSNWILPSVCVIKGYLVFQQIIKLYKVWVHFRKTSVELRQSFNQLVSDHKNLSEKYDNVRMQEQVGKLIINIYKELLKCVIFLLKSVKIKHVYDI